MYKIFDCKVNSHRRPVCLTINPEFSWRLEADRENYQDSYRLRVYDKSLSCIWDTDIIKSNKVHDIPYEGPDLVSTEDYFWQVESFAVNGEHDISSMDIFSIGIIDNSLWSSKWISTDIPATEVNDCLEVWKIMSGGVAKKKFPENDLNSAVYFRKEIQLKKKIKRAKLYATAHGIYSLKINGKDYGYPLAPGITQYKTYLEYQCYDVTKDLNEGDNVLGAIVADGWYRGKIGLLGIGNQWGDEIALYMQLMIEFEDETKFVTGTDEGYKCSLGAYIYADLFVGEGFDARMEPKGWCLPGFDDSSWNTVVLKDYGIDNFEGMRDDPAAFIRVEDPKDIYYSQKGELIIDAGEVVSGFISIKGNAKKDVRISLEHGEIVDKDKNFICNIIGQNKNQTDVYIADHDGEFCFQPKFTFHGFQYVRVGGLTKEDISEVKIYVLASDMQRTSNMITSDSRLNQLLENIYRSQEGNMLYVPTDCPQREKNGFTGDMEIYSSAALIQMDMEAFLKKWFEQIRQEQRDNGLVPIIVPYVESTKLLHNGVEETSAAWGDAAVIIPYRMYKTYGDIRILSENYSMMKRWVSFVEKIAAEEVPEDIGDMTPERREHQKYLWNTGHHFGDWLIPSLSKEGVSNPNIGANMTKGLVAPAYFAYSVSLIAEVASALGEKEDEEYYRNLEEKIKEAYAFEYVDGSGKLKIDYQGMYVLALYMNLIPDNQKQAYIDRLVELIHENGDCLDTGFVSLPYLLDALYDNGQQDLAYKILFQDKCPSWLYEVKMGANAMWESWTNINPDGEINNSSFNHFAFGVVADFIYRKILGLNVIEPGYKKVRIAPDLNCGLTYASGYFMSVYGKIEISWTKLGEKSVLDIKLPPNTSAEIEFAGYNKSVGNGIYHIEA